MRPLLPVMLGLPFIAFFGALWVAILTIISRIGGWWRLSRSYRHAGPLSGNRWLFQSMSMRYSANYNGCLTVTANELGLGFSMWMIFRVAHPPLFVPWQDISIESVRDFLGRERVELRFAREPEVFMRITPRLAQKIAAATPN